MSVKKPRLIGLAEQGPVLSTRASGREAADHVQDAADKGPAVISFAGVEIATPSFLDELVMRAAQLLHGSDALVLVIAELNSEVRESLELVVERRGLQLAVLDEGRIELLGGSRQLQETLVAAQKLGSFKAPELADELKLKLPNLHQRLAPLLESGALTREPDPTAVRGRRHAYRATSPREVDPVNLAVC